MKDFFEGLQCPSVATTITETNDLINRFKKPESVASLCIYDSHKHIFLTFFLAHNYRYTTAG